jgi:hypothetical protein
MYRCYLLRAGRIGRRGDVDIESLDMAIVDCRSMLAMKPASEGFDGFEIWEGRSLIYQSTVVG